MTPTDPLPRPNLESTPRPLSGLAVDQPGVATRGVASLRSLAARILGSIDRSARVALVGVVAAALAAIALGVFITNQTREDLLLAEQRGLQTAVGAITEQLPPIDDPFTAAEIDSVHRLVEEAILDAGHVRVKLWTLDGTIRYSDEPALIDQQFPDEAETLASAEADRPWVSVSALAGAENVYEQDHERLVEHYIPLAGATGPPQGVFEIYSDPAELESALGRIATATWAAITVGLGTLTAFLVALIASTVRRLERDRALAEEAAGASAILASATDALASSSDPPQMLERLGAELTSTLALDDLTITQAPASSDQVASYPLADGSLLTAIRSGAPFTDSEERLLRSVAASLDAALVRAALFERVGHAAAERRRILRRLDAAHEEERSAIVGELHDLLAGDLIRALYGVRGILGRGARDGADIDNELRALEDRIAASEQRLRGFMGRLRPLDAEDSGFVLALEHAVGTAREDSDLAVRLRITGPIDDVPASGQRVLLRSLQEALLNVRKHAAARHVLVRIRVADDIRLSVDDDGCGWSDDVATAPGHGLGLAYARERIEALGGVLILARSRLGGARFEVRLPTGMEP